MTDIPIIRFRPNKSPARVIFGFPWVFTDEVVLDRRSKNIPAGTIVQIQDKEGKDIGLMAFNAESKITGRMMSLDIETRIDLAWVTEKLARAAQMRDHLYDAPFYRLVHAEADGLPGVIIDRFGDAFVVQPNAAWAERMMPEITQAITDLFNPKTIVKSATGRARTLEGLDKESTVLLGALGTPIPVQMNGATYMADLDEGQKTGLYYDQRENHALVAKLAKGGSLLDVFSHVGGFSLAALANGATSATALDGSEAALTLAQAGADASGVQDRFTSHKGDAFNAMSRLAEEGKKFDVVVCDPPAFATSKPALEAGLRAYEKTARMGAKLVADGGYLILCSCSHAADLAKFRKASLVGVGKVGRSGQIIHTGEAGPDHPIHPHLAETSYLKSIFLRLD